MNGLLAADYWANVYKSPLLRHDSARRWARHQDCGQGQTVPCRGSWCTESSMMELFRGKRDGKKSPCVEQPSRMRIHVVAKAVSYAIQLVLRSLALPMPFAVGWNGREWAGASAFSHSVPTFFLIEQHDEDTKGGHVSDGQRIGVPEVAVGLMKLVTTSIR
jgi:hypothetical protein